MAPAGRIEPPDARHHMARLLIAVYLAAACQTSTVAPTPSTTPAGSAPPATSAPTASSSPDALRTPGPLPTGEVGGEVPAIRPLPLPTLSEPFAIGEALYDPGRMDEAVVSLLHLMGIGIYDRDGGEVQRGDERVAGDPWLTEDEVWALIEVGIEDIFGAGDDGPRHRLQDLFEALASSLPGMTSEQFIAAYTSAYTEHPDHLVPQLLLGQPVDAETPLTRVQLWLLYVDGFVDLAEPAAARLAAVGPVVQVGPRPPSGTANANLPSLTVPPNLQPIQHRELLVHLPTLAATIPFHVGSALVHEGHGGQGAPGEILAVVGPGRAFVSPITGQTLLEGRQVSNIALEWSTNDQAVLNAHGTLSTALPSTVQSNGIARLGYTPKREAADGRGIVASEWATIDAGVATSELLDQVYVLDATTLSVISFLMPNKMKRSGGFQIEWHDVGLKLTITNTYEVTLDVLPAGGEARVHRKGTDTFKGVLTPRLGGAYYAGTLEATSAATSEMDFVVPLVGDRCEDSTSSTQRLDVVGIPIPTANIDPALDVRAAGEFGTTDLVLRFYPASPPSGALGRCQGTIDYIGPGPTCFLMPGAEPDQCPPNTMISGTYLAFNDTRITDPMGPGPLLIHLPPRDGGLQYEDWRQVLPALGVDSVFDIVVTAFGAP